LGTVAIKKTTGPPGSLSQVANAPADLGTSVIAHCHHLALHCPYVRPNGWASMANTPGLMSSAKMTCGAARSELVNAKAPAPAQVDTRRLARFFTATPIVQAFGEYRPANAAS